ncbi:MAG: peptidoglycan DD-metalloendopeptidase family protein [Ilumatobacteraceae bacterium]
MVPVPGALIRHFQAPACERCAGHRGVTLRTAMGDSVVAVANGEVDFVGEVGGTLYVVQRVAPTIRVTYGHLATVLIRQGVRLSAGEPLGAAGETTYLSVRVGETHVEPLRALGLGRPRLVASPVAVTQIVGSSGSPR